MTSTGRRLLLPVAVLTTVVLLLGSCGDDDLPSAEVDLSDISVPDLTTSPTAGGETGDGGGEFETQNFDVDHAVWHSGFRIEVVGGSFYAEEDEFTDRRTYFVSLDTTLENITGETSFFSPEVALTSGASAYPAPFNLERPDVPGGLSTEAELVFVVDEDFEVEDAQLIFGTAEENQAVLPLGPDTGELVTLEPTPVDVAATLSMELIDIEIVGATLSPSIDAVHTGAPAGELALTLDLEITSRRSGNWSVFPTDLVLVDSEDRAIGVDGAELGSLAGASEGILHEDLYVRFLVDEGYEGEYELRFEPGSWFVGEDGVTQGSVAFTIPGDDT